MKWMKSEQCDVSEMDGATIIINGQDNSLHVLNETASAIWEVVDSAETEEVVAHMAQKFSGADPETVAEDTRTMLDMMKDKQLIFEKD